METVRVIYRIVDDGTWWGQSPDVENWTVLGDTYAEARRLAEEGIPWTLERDDVVVEHFVTETVVPDAALAAPAVR